MVKMSREINFRAWDGSGFYSPIIQGDNIYRNGRDFEDGITANDDILMQYTGLKDRNKKHIYEGDIVRILYTDWPSKNQSDERTLEEYMKDIALIRLVVYSENGFYLSESIDGYADSIDSGRHGYIEVTGNIYENPELIP